jgi:hypothetical protein
MSLVKNTSKSKSSLLKLVLPEYHSKIKGNWKGTSIKTLIFTELYLKNKYDNILHTIPFLMLQLDTVHFFGNPTKHYSLIMDNFNKNMIEIIKPNKDYIKSFFQKTEKRYTFYPVILTVSYNGIAQESEYHSVFFLYDKIYDKVELFNSLNDDLTPFKSDIKIFFTALYGSKIKIIYPNKKLQTIGDLYFDKCTQNDLNFTTTGFCLIWTFWYLEMILSNPKMTTAQVYQKTIKLLNTHPDIVCKIPIGYANFINEATKELDLDFSGNTIKIIRKKDKYKYQIPKKLILLLGLAGALFYTLNQLLFKKIKKI